MNTESFLKTLRENKEKALYFEYEAGVFVPISYHITEVKNAHFDSVDCGGVAHDYRQTIVQLWVDPKEKVETAMEVEKALHIFDRVNSIKPINLETEIFFEYGYQSLKTSVYKVSQVKVEAERVVIALDVPPPSCKPRDLAFQELKVAGNGCGTGNGGCCN